MKKATNNYYVYRCLKVNVRMLPVRVGLKSFIVGSGRNGTGKLHCQSPHGHIAQWIEHFHPKERVAGSIPAVSAMFASLIFRCKANVL